MELDPTRLGMEFGGGALIGGIIGFAAKQVARIVALIVGLQLALLAFLESSGYIIVDWEALTGGIVETSMTAAAEQPPDWLMGIVSTLSIGAGFTGGFLVGFRYG